MTIGYPDWWLPVLPSYPFLGEGQYYWSRNESKQIAAAGHENFFSWPVVAGRRLYLCGFAIWAQIPGMHQVWPNTAWAAGSNIYFDTHILVPYSPGGISYVDGPDTFLFTIQNNAEKVSYFFAMVQGFEQLI